MIQSQWLIEKETPGLATGSKFAATANCQTFGAYVVDFFAVVKLAVVLWCYAGGAL